MSGLKVFFDAFSQPSRAVLLLLNVNKVKYEPKLIKIAEMENRSNEEFLEVCATRQVPAIDDNGFKLFDSAAIMKYLVTKYQLPDHWYPADPQRQAKIDEYLHWHHSNLRVGAAHTIFNKVFLPNMTGQAPDEEMLKTNEKILNKSKKILETHFLRDTKFINSDDISIADLQAMCEFTEFWVAGIDPLADKPRLSQWLADCQKELAPHFDEVHKTVYMARDRGIFKGKL